MPRWPEKKIVKALAPNQQIAAYYRTIIDRGSLTHGQPIPPRRELAADWGVSIETIRKAFNLLKDDGYIHGTNQGTYAVGPEHRDVFAHQA